MFDRPINILLAEDSEDNQFFFELITKQCCPEANLEIAENGEIAVKKFKEKNYDIVFMDIQMPKKNGLEATLEMRSSCGEKGKKIPVVAVTAYAEPEERENFVKNGFNDIITKPVSAEDIKQIMLRFLNN